MVTAAVRRFFPQRRWLRWTLAAIGLVVLAVAACEAVGWPFVREPLARRLSASLARDIAFGSDFKLQLLGSVRLHTDSLVIGSPAGAPVVHNREGQAQPFLSAHGVSLVLPYSTVYGLLHGDQPNKQDPPRIRSLDVTRIELGLARRSDGVANWQLGKPDPQDERPTLPQFDRLVVQEGRLRLDDSLARLVLDASLRTREGARAGSEGAGLEMTAVGQYKKSPLQARFQSSGLLPLAAPSAENTPAVPLRLELRAGDTHLVLDGRGRDLMQLSSLDAQVQLKGPSLAAIGEALGVTLPNSPPFALRGQLRKTAAVWNAVVEDLAVGSSRLKGEFTYDPSQAVPALQGRLGGARLALSDLAPALGAGGDARADATPDRVLPQHEFRLSALRAMNADLAVRLDQVYLGTTQLDTLAPLEGRLLLRDRVLSIEDLVARASGGELRGTLSLDARQKQALWRADLRWSGVRLERFIKARNPRADAAKAPSPAYISGMLGGRAKLAGAGNSTAAMLGSLDGSTELWVRNGSISSLLIELSGIDVAESLGVIVRGDEGLPLRCAVARLSVQNGVMRPEVAVVDTPDTTLIVDGRVSLGDERLGLVLTAKPRDASALALRSPVRVEGTFAKPEIKLDKGTIGLRIAAAAALASIAPLAGLLALADVGDPERAVCEQALQHLQSTAAPGAPKRTAPAKRK